MNMTMNYLSYVRMVFICLVLFFTLQKYKTKKPIVSTKHFSTICVFAYRMQSWCKRIQPKNSLWYHMKHPTVNSHQVCSNFVSIYNKAEHWHSQRQVFFWIKQYFKDLKQYQRNHSNGWSKYYNSYFWALSNDILWKLVCFLCTQLVCNVRPFQPYVQKRFHTDA